MQNATSQGLFVMTSKERITTAMKCGKPDRVPVTIGLSEIIPVRYYGNDYIQFFIKDKFPLWKARVEVEHDKFGGDAFLHLFPGPSPHDPEKTRTIIKESCEEIHYRDTYHTRKGDLSAEFFIGRNSPVSSITHFIADPEADFPKITELLKHPDSCDLEEINTAYKEIGDRAHVGLWLSTPIDWWSSLRGTQNMIMDLMLLPEFMSDVFKVYAEYMTVFTEYTLKNTVFDSVGLGGSTTSMSVISPDLHRRFSLDFGKAICKTSHRFGIPVQYHMCGKSREALPITAEMGVDGFDALECPPTGNANLAEVKKTFGKTISLRGNVNSIHVMGNGSTADVENAVKDCMEAAKTDGGYILGVGDQTPAQTPEENLFAFVEAGRKYGKY
jgi:hypothetical protein